MERNGLIAGAGIDGSGGSTDWPPVGQLHWEPPLMDPSVRPSSRIGHRHRPGGEPGSGVRHRDGIDGVALAQRERPGARLRDGERRNSAALLRHRDGLAQHRDVRHPRGAGAIGEEGELTVLAAVPVDGEPGLVALAAGHGPAALHGNRIATGLEGSVAVADTSST